MQKKLALGIAPIVVAVLAGVVVMALVLAPHSTHANVPSGSAQVGLAQLEHPHPSTQASTDNHARLVFRCDVASTATPVVDVQEFVTGDADSGFYGTWAIDTYKRSIQIWSLGGGMYCANVNYDGTFAAIRGASSPNSVSITLTGNETGHMFGGYVSVPFQGTLNVNDPVNWPAHGLAKPKPVDYQCISYGNCPGYVSWLDKYFSAASGFDFADWGWRYFASDPAEGSWTNAASGSFGNIV